MKPLIKLLCALVLAGTAYQAGANEQFRFAVTNNGPEALTVGCHSNSGSAIAVGGTDNVVCSGATSSSTNVYFGTESRAHNCPVDDYDYVRHIQFSYDSNRTPPFRVDEYYCLSGHESAAPGNPEGT